MLVEHAPSKPLFGRCFALTTAHMTPMDIATIGIKIVGSHVFRELKGSLNSFLDTVQTGRAELEVQINKQFHRDHSGEIMESDEDSEGNLRDFVVDDDVVIMDTDAEEDMDDEDEDEEELVDDDGDDDHDDDEDS
eukprot:gene26644-33550_t